MINGLRDKEAVKLDKGYLVCLSHSAGYRAKIEVDGVELETRGQFVVESLDNIYIKHHIRRKVNHYEDKSGKKYTIQEINHIRYKYDDEDGDPCYPSLEDQIEHITALKWIEDEVTAIYDPEKIEREKVEFTVIGSLESTGSQYIDTPFLAGQRAFPGQSGIYRIRAGLIAKNEALKVFEELPKHVRRDIPTHSNLKYLKVNGEYVFTNYHASWVSREDSVHVVNTLEEAQGIELKIRKAVREHIEMHAYPAGLDEYTKAELYAKLQTLKNQVQSISPMKASRGYKTTAMETLNEIITRLTNDKG